MCFSAGASFAAGAVISAVAVATAVKVRKPSQRLFASIPFIFAVQQFAEGFLWLALKEPGYQPGEKLSAYIFLVAANVIWPTFIPLSILLMEDNPLRRKLMKVLLVTGILVSSYYGICLLLFSINPQIANCHIRYDGRFPVNLMMPMFLLYVSVTIIPLFLSTMKKMKILGSMMFLACVLTVIFYIENVTSVWCFFAAVISVMIYWIVTSEKG